MRFIIRILLISFLFVSCASRTDFQSLYDEGQYSAIVEESEAILQEKLDADVLYYRMMSQFRLGLIDDSLSSARVYAACRDTVSDQKTRDALRIILFYAEPAESCYAGRKLSGRFTLSAAETLVYFSSLMKTQRYSEANELYSAMRQSLSDQQAVLMLLSGKASSESILYEIRKWKSGITDDAEFDSALVSAIRLLNDRGEGDKLLDLAISRYDSSKDDLALAIGDIYFTEGDVSRARSYWSNAYNSYPDEVKARLTYL